MVEESIEVNDPDAPSSIQRAQLVIEQPPLLEGGVQVKLIVVVVVEEVIGVFNEEGAVQALNVTSEETGPSPLKLTADTLNEYE